MQRQMDLQFDTPASVVVEPPSSGSATSEAAAASMSSAAGNLRTKVLAYIIERDGATDAEIAEYFGLADNTLRPRRWELVKAGLIYRTTETRTTPSGRQAAVFRAFTEAPEYCEPAEPPEETTDVEPAVE